ncbi:MAG: DNA-binding protein [Nitrososphaerota archaeon]|nr:DNA-binding protein [Nitrososphaerota archaeon]MDG7026418.1 DNA-binding protein [Nitrososphaerota archaeon]
MAKIHSLKAGSQIHEGVLAAAAEDGVSTALVTGLGGVREVRLAYYDRAAKKYEERTFQEQLELTSLVGNVTMRDGALFLHAHGTFARRDYTVIGGHVVSGVVSPLLEFVLTPAENAAVRELDESLGLYTIRNPP